MQLVRHRGPHSNTPYPISVQTAEASRPAHWRKEDLKALVLRIPLLAINSMDIMSAYVQEYQDRFRELATERVERRLARTSPRLASQSGGRNPRVSSSTSPSPASPWQR